jgi:hypothetical protein
MVEENDIKAKTKEAVGKIKDTLVQEDNPNSPHLVISRMNQNIMGDAASDEPASPKEEKPVHKKHDPVKHFDRLVWGDDE